MGSASTDSVWLARWLVTSVLATASIACGGDESGGAGDVSSDTGVGDTGGDVAADTNAGGDVASDTGGATSFCRDDGECAGAGEVCDCRGQCVVATGKECTEDRNCGVPNWCNTCTGRCEAQVGVCEACTESRGCLDQGACLPYGSGGTYCGLGCVSDAGCPQGFSCLGVDGVGAKQCVARSGACEDLGLCAGDGECPVGQICSETTRTCAGGCSEDGQCQNGNVCVAARCVPPCGGDGDCTAPATCQGGKCKIPGACEAAADCPTPATYCDKTTGQCAPGCLADADCKDAAKICQDKSCVDKGCKHNFECAFGKVCEKASGQCVPYPAGEPYCAECNAEAEDNPSCPSPNMCVRFQDENQQPLGDHCLVPCKDDPIDRCPSGWQCQKLEDPESGAEQFFCARMCYIEPVGTTP